MSDDYTHGNNVAVLKGDVKDHHTPKQIAKAFKYVPTILKQLKEAGVLYPSFRLYEDASGTLYLGDEVTSDQYELAVKLIKSRRQSLFSKGIAIDFCCGLVVAAEA